MRNVLQALIGPSDLADTEARQAEQITAVLRGLEDLANYTGSRPDQRWEFKLPSPVYQEFLALTRKLRGESPSVKHEPRDQKQSFSAFVPFPLFLQFKQLNQELQKKVPDEFKDDFTMTAWGNLAVANIILPALHELTLRASVDPDFRSAAEKSKSNYTMTAWITASIEKNIVPALREAIRQANDACADKLQAA
jgi:hypothetical protein